MKVMGIPMDTKPRMSPLFTLLQISDPQFPIGGYTQSYGLETYVQKEIVHDTSSAALYLKSYLLNNFLYNELLSAKLAWEYGAEENIQAIGELDQLLSAAKGPRELRTASIKLGTRFLKLIQGTLGEKTLMQEFSQGIKKGKFHGHHCVLFGLATNLFGIGKIDALSALSYSTASSIVTNCAKLVPISQNDGQTILFQSQEVFAKLIEQVEDLDENDVGVCCFGFDLRSMQHERLYTRLYIS